MLYEVITLSIEQGQSVQLMPDGLGARQLFNWYEEMGLNPMGALLIQPTAVEDSSMSLLFVITSYSIHYTKLYDSLLIKASSSNQQITNSFKNGY